MPRKKAASEIMDQGPIEHMETGQEFGADFPQLNVNMQPSANDVMGQMGSPTAMQASNSETSTPQATTPGGTKRRSHRKYGKHHEFEDAQPHGHHLRNHHGYNLRFRSVK